MVKGNAIPGQALRAQDVEHPEFLDSRYMKFVRLSTLRTGRLYTPRDNSGALSVRDWVDQSAVVLPEELSQWKFVITKLVIEPAIFWLVVQRLNQLHHRLPPSLYVCTYVCMCVCVFVCRETGSLVGIPTGRSVFRIPTGTNMFCFPKRQDLLWGPTSPPQNSSGSFIPGDMRRSQLTFMYFRG